MRGKSLAAGALVLAVGACSTTKDAENLKKLKVSFSWKNVEACSDRPPAFTIGNVPDGTAKLRFELNDLDVPGRRGFHRGGTVPYTGTGDISAGAFEFAAPCPPDGETHAYKWMVEALDAEGDTVLARGTATKTFPPER